jgi:hypothetical protein
MTSDKMYVAWHCFSVTLFFSFFFFNFFFFSSSFLCICMCIHYIQFDIRINQVQSFMWLCTRKKRQKWEMVESVGVGDHHSQYVPVTSTGTSKYVPISVLLHSARSKTCSLELLQYNYKLFVVFVRQYL